MCNWVGDKSTGQVIRTERFDNADQLSKQKSDSKINCLGPWVGDL